MKRLLLVSSACALLVPAADVTAVQVRQKDLNDPKILGQQPHEADKFL